MNKRTYYCVETVAMYPVDEIRVSEKSWGSDVTQYRVRAASRREAENILRERLNREREESLKELTGVVS